MIVTYRTGGLKMKGIILSITTVTFFAIIGIWSTYFAPKETPEAHEVIIVGREEESKILDVPAVCQYPKLPTGCESVSAVMVLQYYGRDISAEEFAGSWLKCSKAFYTSDKKQYGPDPNQVFAGDPFSENAYGCFAQPIADAVNENCTDLAAEVIRGTTLADLCREYVDNDIPIPIWATMGMKESKRGRTWFLKNGESFTWTSGEHCLVLVGYNGEYYFFNDPQSGSTVAYQRDISEKRFAELGSQAVYIHPTE